MKHLLIAAIFILFQWSAENLTAQDDNAASLKTLLIKKFDLNHDGTLNKKEQNDAVFFLQQADTDRNSAMSEKEQAVAIANLKRMPDPKKSTGIKPKITIAGQPGTTGSTKNQAAMRAAQQKKNLKTSGADSSSLKAKGYYVNTTIIAVAGAHTVVPKGAVIYVPALMEKMIVTQPKGQLIGWPEFRNKYARYINTLEVTAEMAQGEERIKSADKSAFSDNKKIVVAVIDNNPTSVSKPARKR